MASNMQDIKRRIRSVSSTEHITSAMKLVSAAKLRRAKKVFDESNKYFRAITGTIEDIFRVAEDLPSLYVTPKTEERRRAYIFITGNKGLCGAYNSGMLKTVEATLAGQEDECLLFPIGTKGRDYFARRGYEIEMECTIPSETITMQDLQPMMDRIFELYDTGEINSVHLIYTAFKNSLEQEIKELQILPLAATCESEEEEYKPKVEYEPSPLEVFNYLIPKYVSVQIYGAVVEAATCEHAARRMAMENATDNARDMLGRLSLFYNRARQSAITNEIIEVVSGSEAQK